MCLKGEGESVKILGEACNEDIGATEREPAAYM